MVATAAMLVGFFGLTAGALMLTERRQGLVVLAAGPPHGLTGDRTHAVAKVARDTARGVVRSPWLWLGVAGSVVLVLVEGRPRYPGALMVGWFQPVLLGGFVALHRTVARSNVLGAGDEPVAVAAAAWPRTLGHLLAALAVATVLGAACIVTVGIVTGPLDALNGWQPREFELLQLWLAPLVMAGVAVAAAQWWPHPVGAVAVLVVVFFSPFAWVLDLHHHAGRRAPAEPGEPLGVVSTTSLAWHTFFLVGFAAFGAAVALLRVDRRPVMLAATTAAVLAMSAGVLLRPG